MNCANCTKTKPIFNCTGTLTIGTIEEAETDVLVYFKSARTGRIACIQAQSDADGLVVIDISEISFSANTDYTAWITLNVAENIEAEETFNIDGGEFECVIVNFERVHLNNLNLASSGQKLALL